MEKPNIRSRIPDSLETKFRQRDVTGNGRKEGIVGFIRAK
jgi:hypothetical protein